MHLTATTCPNQYHLSKKFIIKKNEYKNVYYIAHLLNNRMLVTISTLVVDVNDKEPPLGQSSKTGIGGKVPKSFHELDSAGTRVERLEHIVIWWKSECGRVVHWPIDIFDTNEPRLTDRWETFPSR